MPSLAAARASNAIFHPSYVPVGVFVGGTSGVGEAMVKAIASHLGGNIHIIIVGRNRSAAEKTFASIPRPTGEDGKPVRRDFIYCDAFLMRNIKATCVELSERLTKVNFLVLSAGYFEVTSRKETEEGLDKMLVMRYYNRFKFTLELLPLLKHARALGEEANVMSILGPAPFTVKINIDDLDMKKSYGAFRAAIHTGVYNDIIVEQFSKRHPEVTFTHIYPGIVNTPAVAHTWAAWWPLIVLRPLIGVLMYFFGETAEASAEYMLYGLLHAKKGWYRRNNHGDDSGVENFGHTEEEKLAVWNHSCSITDV